MTLQPIKKKIKSFSMSSTNFNKNLNLSEERDRVNRILAENLKIQQAKAHRKVASFSMHGIKQKFIGNRYTSSLLQNFC